MSRLFYEDPNKKIITSGFQPEMKSGENNNTDSSQYLEKVTKLIPSEVIVVYLFILGVAPSIGIPFIKERIHWVNWIAFIFFLVSTPLYLKVQAKRERKKGEPLKPIGMHLILSTIAFVFWAYVTTGNVVVPNAYDSALASIFLAVFSFVSGFIPLNK